MQYKKVVRFFQSNKMKLKLACCIIAYIIRGADEARKVRFMEKKMPRLCVGGIP